MLETYLRERFGVAKSHNAPKFSIHFDEHAKCLIAVCFRIFLKVGSRSYTLFVFLREAPITFPWPTRSQCPSVRPRPPSVRPASGQISKCPKNGPPETDFRGDRTGRGVPILVHFWDLTQIRQLTQSDPIILILCVHKKPKWITQRFAPPALRVLSSLLRGTFLETGNSLHK